MHYKYQLQNEYNIHSFLFSYHSLVSTRFDVSFLTLVMVDSCKFLLLSWALISSCWSKQPARSAVTWHVSDYKVRFLWTSISSLSTQASHKSLLNMCPPFFWDCFLRLVCIPRCLLQKKFSTKPAWNILSITFELCFRVLSKAAFKDLYFQVKCNTIIVLLHGSLVFEI